MTDPAMIRSPDQITSEWRIYDGPTEVHKWSLAKKIKRDHRDAASLKAVA